MKKEVQERSRRPGECKDSPRADLKVHRARWLVAALDRDAKVDQDDATVSSEGKVGWGDVAVGDGRGEGVEVGDGGEHLPGERVRDEGEVGGGGDEAGRGEESGECGWVEWGEEEERVGSAGGEARDEVRVQQRQDLRTSVV